jgi:lysophospholipase L1-like esterase
MKKRKDFFTRAKIGAFGVLFLVMGVTSLQAQAFGDVNSNGTIDIVDALLIAQYYVGLSPSNFNPANADANCSGAIDIVDALLIAQYYVGLISQFTCATQPPATPVATPIPAQPTATPGNITVWLAGDSTMATGSSTCPIGYGGQLQQFFDSRVTVANYARGGRSVNTWLYNVLSTASSNGDCDITKDSSGNPTVTADWKAMLDGMKAGDYLIISFGINDGTSACPRHASQATFMADLALMAQAAKARGANPIFMTPTSSISCSGGTAVGTRGAYVIYTITAGQQNSVPVIDLHELSVNYYNASGFCPLPNGATDITADTSGAVGAFFCDDHTHFDTTGAKAIAQLIANAIRSQNLGLSAYLK